MAYETGTATGHIDLLDKLIHFLTTHTDLVTTGENWTTLSTRDEGWSRQYFMKAPGVTTTEDIYINFRSFEDAPNDRYNWHVKGALSYSSASPLEGQPNTSPRSYVYLWNQPMPYWFVANGQRVIMVAKVSTTYIVTYFGKILPYGTPASFPYPLLIGGVGNQSTLRWSDSSITFDLSCLMSPGAGCQLYTSDGGWRIVRNRSGAKNTDTSYLNMFPTAAGGFFKGASTSSWRAFDPIQPNIDGSYNLLPFYIGTEKNYPSRNCFGELDGLFWVTGVGNSSENIITINQVDYLVVQNMHRTDWEEYGAVRLQ